jgi:hypothetical protein
MRALAVLAATAAVASGCVLGVQSFAGKTCDVAADCPNGFSCVLARPGQGRTCEMLRGPDFADGGGVFAPAYYCGEVEPILKRTCLKNCHGADHSGAPGTINDKFRLDMYISANGIKGALEMSDRVKARASDKSPSPMPPEIESVQPTPEERSIIARWFYNGAPFSSDGGGACDGGALAPLP